MVRELDIFSRLNPAVISDSQNKRERLREWMDKRGLDGVILSKADSFAWITTGGNNRVVNDSEIGVGHIVITKDEHYLIAYYMDADRLYEEQVPGQGYQLIKMYWHEGDERIKAKKLAGLNAGADTHMPDVEYIAQEINDLQWPITQLELDRYRVLGKIHNDVLLKIFNQVMPGMRENEVYSSVVSEFSKYDIKVDVSICGSDERIDKYRHILPTDKQIDKYLILGPVISKSGLHSLVSRSMYFGDPPERIKKAFKAAATIQGRIFKELKPGLKFSKILELQKKWYADLGYPDGWHYHFQGGPTGYVVVDVGKNQTNQEICAPQPYSWFTTIQGAKVEELSILTHKGIEIASMFNNWPTIEVETNNGAISVPGMLIR